MCVHPDSKLREMVRTHESLESFRGRGQQGVHSSAANEDGCGYSVKQSGTPDCVPALYRVKPMSVLRLLAMLK